MNLTMQQTYLFCLDSETIAAGLEETEFDRFFDFGDADGETTELGSMAVSWLLERLRCARESLS
jgi:hypothetical protein